MTIPRPETSQAPSPFRPERSKKRPKKVPTLNELAETTTKVAKNLWKSLTDLVTKLSPKESKGLMPALTGFLAFFTKDLPGKLSKKIKEGKEKRENKKKRKGKKEKVGKKPKKIKTNVKLKELMGEIKLEQKPLDHTKIHSAPFEKGNDGITLCAKTSNANLKQFGFDRFFSATAAIAALNAGRPFDTTGLPSGHAHHIMDYYIKSNRFEKFVGSNEKIYNQLKGNTRNVAHLVVKSSSMKWEHSAIAFRSETDGNWYVLDPYRSGRSQEPIPFEKYSGNIKIAVPLSASKNPSKAIA